jgi:hypothetical protein
VSETPIFGLPRPDLPDAADGPGAFEDLSDRAEAVLAAGIRSSGSAVIGAEQPTSSGAYALLGTPDRVQDIVLPDDGLLFVAYQALVKGVGAAALFLDANQVRVAEPNVAPVVAEVAIAGTEYEVLTGAPDGLAISPGSHSGADTGIATTTGLALAFQGGPAAICAIRADAGTYDVAVKFKASFGPVTAKQRQLYVWSMAFGMPPP